MNTKNTDSFDDFINEKNASSLKSLSTFEIEKAIATTLTDLLNWNYDVQVSSIRFTSNNVEISLEVKQTFQKKE